MPEALGIGQPGRSEVDIVMVIESIESWIRQRFSRGSGVIFQVEMEATG